MKFTDLSVNNLLEIVKFLEFNEALALKETSKLFFRLFEKFGFILQEKFLFSLNLPISNDYLPWKQIIENIKASKGMQDSLIFFPYFTNGGTFGDSFEYFINNLQPDHQAYCTTNGKNVLVKYLFLKDIEFDYYPYINNYLTQPNEYNIAEIQAHENDFTDVFPMIHSICFKLPGYGFDCSIKSAICFSSIEKVTDFSFFSKFYDCNSKKKILQIAAEMGMIAQYKEIDENKVITFSNTRNNIQCLCWIKIKYPVHPLYSLWIDLMKNVFARYFYLMLIDGMKSRRTYNNIDTGPIYPSSKLIKLKNLPISLD